MNNYLITGANSDIGRFTIQNLVNDPENNVVGISRSKSKQESKANLRLYDEIDLTEEQSILTLTRLNEANFQKPFVLIHCVGDFWHHKNLEKTSHTEAKNQILSHYFTLFNVLKSAIPVMKKVGGGKIIAFSCNSVGINYPDMAAFTSAKGAIETFIKCTANENAEFNIAANVLALSTIKTDKVIASKDEKYHDYYLSVEELYDSIIYLSKAPAFMTGNVIKLFKYSKYYYSEGYYDRNKII